MPRPTLQQLLDTVVVGNAFHDNELLHNLMLTALDKRVPMADRAKAVRYAANVVMTLNIKNHASDDLEVAQYVRSLREELGEDFQHVYEQANETGEWSNG